jgi:hypothetical protein
MKSIINIESYEIKTSRTDQKIPIINGVHIHSVYNPYKEAEGLIEKHLEAISNKVEVLVLGLGFAYHVNELIQEMSKVHGDNFKIVVIEPNLQVYNDCIELGLLNKKNVIVFAGYTPHELFSDSDLVHFLLKKPTVIAHPPSFNLYQLYFKEILTFEAPTNLVDSLSFLTNDKVKKYLNTFKGTSTFEEISEVIVPEKNSITELDFAILALAEITRNSKNINKKSNTGEV